MTTIDADFYIKQGSRFPSLVATLSDDNGPIDLTGYTLAVYMRPASGGANIITGAAAIADSDQVANKGRFQYDWGANDTLLVDHYILEVKATIAGKPEIFPSKGYFRVTVQDSLV